MLFNIKIIGKTTMVELQADSEENAFKGLELFIDTVDENVNQRSTNVMRKVTFSLAISEDTKVQCKDLMDWALNSTGSDVYREVDIKILNTDKDIVRHFKLEDMFVIDYKEVYSDKENENYLQLYLAQKAGKVERFKQNYIEIE